MTKARSLRADFEKAITRLEEALALTKDPIVRDSAIQRFEISFELCWKYLKAYLEEEHNATCTSLRTCFRAAFRHGVLDNDPFWIDLTVLRNYTIPSTPITKSSPSTCIRGSPRPPGKAP